MKGGEGQNRFQDKNGMTYNFRSDSNSICLKRYQNNRIKKKGGVSETGLRSFTVFHIILKEGKINCD